MNFTYNYKQALNGLHADEDILENVTRTAEIKPKRKTPVWIKATACVSCLAIITVCAANFTSISTFAKSLFGISTYSVIDDEKINLGEAEPIEGFDCGKFLESGELSITFEGDKNGNSRTEYSLDYHEGIEKDENTDVISVSKRFDTYSQLVDNVKECGIILPYSDFLDSVLGGGMFTIGYSDHIMSTGPDFTSYDDPYDMSVFTGWKDNEYGVYADLNGVYFTKKRGVDVTEREETLYGESEYTERDGYAVCYKSAGSFKNDNGTVFAIYDEVAKPSLDSSDDEEVVIGYRINFIYENGLFHLTMETDGCRKENADFESIEESAENLPDVNKLLDFFNSGCKIV